MKPNLFPDDFMLCFYQGSGNMGSIRLDVRYREDACLWAKQGFGRKSAITEKSLVTYGQPLKVVPAGASRYRQTMAFVKGHERDMAPISLLPGNGTAEFGWRRGNVPIEMST